MIDVATGDLRFEDGTVIGPSTARTAWLGGEPAPAWSTCTLPARAMDGIQFGASLTFRGDTLAWINLWQVELDAAPGWAEASLEREQAAQRRNEAWLARTLGPPHESFPRAPYPPGTRYRFSWGTIESLYTPQSAEASLVIAYG
jgi:hypothetical protein